MTIATLTDEQRAFSSLIAIKLVNLGIEAKFVEPISTGPIVSVYRFQPQGKTTVGKIESIAQDIAIALGSEDVVVKRMPGESSVSIFIPNPTRKWLMWRDEVGQAATLAKLQNIPLFLGIDYLGRYVVEDLSLMPHLLIAGSTGGGKSTLLSSLIATMIYCKSPDEVKLILSDTKGVEFGHFIGSPHLLFDPATSVYQTLERLDWLIEEMNDRLRKLGKHNSKNIAEYNAIASNISRSGSLAPLPYITLIIDELADILSSSSKLEEDRGPSIGKVAKGKLSLLAQKARATGIHIIAATQRPSVKLIDGDIKANFPARLSFKLPSQADSRTVLDTGGAEHLLARGDMLFVNPQKPGLHRIHAPWAKDTDIQACVEFRRNQ